MKVIDYTKNLAIPVVKNALDTGLDLPGSNAAPTASFTSTCAARPAPSTRPARPIPTGP